MEVQRLCKDQRIDLTIIKANMPEITLMCIDNGSISAVKGGQTAIYLDYAILAQILLVINFPDNLDSYQYENNEVLLMFLYTTRKMVYIEVLRNLWQISFPKRYKS